MRYILLVLLIISMSSKAQTILKFDKRFVESEDKWVAFSKGKDSTYVYGFIYIDAQAGLTLNYEGNFKISESGEFIPKKLEKASYKVRLQPNNILVAFIPENKYKELQIESIPTWLNVYKSDTSSVGHLYRWGFLYNSYNECAKALTYLERAKAIDSKYKGLSVELAFSYNCLGEYLKAITVLKDAIEATPKDAYTHKELIYAQMKSGQLEAAAESCRMAIAVCDDESFHGENSYNLLYEYYLKKDGKNFNLWLDEAKKWNSGNPTLMNSIKKMEEDLSK